MQVQCNKCGGRLEVAETLTNQQVRCPICEFVVEVTAVAQETVDVDCELPQDAGSPSATRQFVGDGGSDEVDATPGPVERRLASKDSQWFMKVPEGAEFGPVALKVLEQWVTQGRVATDCRIRMENTEWLAAAEYYPELAAGVGKPTDTRIGVTPVEPHRGMFILSLAVVGCLVPFFSVWPAVAGTQDLRKMVAGKMDRGGEAMTRAGQAIGMVSSIIWIGAFAITLLAVLVATLSNLTR